MIYCYYLLSPRLVFVCVKASVRHGTGVNGRPNSENLSSDCFVGLCLFFKASLHLFCQPWFYTENDNNSIMQNVHFFQFMFP